MMWQRSKQNFNNQNVLDELIDKPEKQNQSLSLNNSDLQRLRVNFSNVIEQGLSSIQQKEEIKSHIEQILKEWDTICSNDKESKMFKSFDLQEQMQKNQDILKEIMVKKNEEIEKNREAFEELFDIQASLMNSLKKNIEQMTQEIVILQSQEQQKKAITDKQQHFKQQQDELIPLDQQILDLEQRLQLLQQQINEVKNIKSMIKKLEIDDKYYEKALETFKNEQLQKIDQIKIEEADLSIFQKNLIPLEKLKRDLDLESDQLETQLKNICQQNNTFQTDLSEDKQQIEAIYEKIQKQVHDITKYKLQLKQYEDQENTLEKIESQGKSIHKSSKQKKLEKQQEVQNMQENQKKMFNEFKLQALDKELEKLKEESQKEAKQLDGVQQKYQQSQTNLKDEMIKVSIFALLVMVLFMFIK